MRSLLIVMIAALMMSCDSGPTQLGRLLKGHVVGCQSTSEIIDSRIGYWEDHPPDTQAFMVTPGWQNQSRTLPSRFPGVLVTVRIDQVAEIIVDRKAGVAESASIKPWKRTESMEERFFTTELGCDCSSNTFEADETLFAGAMPPGGFPPKHIAPFLGVDQLSRAPILFTEYWKLSQ